MEIVGSNRREKPLLLVHDIVVSNSTTGIGERGERGRIEAGKERGRKKIYELSIGVYSVSHSLRPVEIKVTLPVAVARTSVPRRRTPVCTEVMKEWNFYGAAMPLPGWKEL